MEENFEIEINDEKPGREAPKKAVNSVGADIYDWIQSIVTAFVIGIFIFTFVGRVVRVDGRSMYATLHHNDFVLTSNLFYTPKNGDIVVFYNDADEEPLVKRVIAVGGQTVDIDFYQSIVYVDGVALDEPYTNTPTVDRHNFTGPLTVPEGYLFVMGDNRGVSRDSRSSTVGLVDSRSLVGKVYCLVLPGEDSENRRDWTRWGSTY